MTAESTLDLPITHPAQQAGKSVVFVANNPKKLALDDFKEGLRKWPVWLMLAYQDIKLRYRRSVLGPFWITLSMAITAYSMGMLYSHLFHTDLQSYFPFLVGGMITWALISTLVIELTDAFSFSFQLIRQLKLPYTLYIHRIVARNLIIFFHNTLVILPVLAIFHHVAKVNWNTLFIVVGIFIVYVNAIFYGLILAMVGARFRDISQIIKSLIQVVFFLTPVMWRPDALPANKKFIVMLNPFSSFVEIIRGPLTGTLPSLYDLVIVSSVTVLGILICYAMFVRYRARIVYWL